MLQVLLVLLLLQIVKAAEPVYDEDRHIPNPSSYIAQNIDDPKSETVIAYIDNCRCAESPYNYGIVCGGKCKRFPSTVKIKVPIFEIKYTSIQEIKRDDFLLISNISVLEIEANMKLSRFEPGCFRKMSNLRNFSAISNPSLSYLEEGTFEGLVNLENLSLVKNGFRHVIDVTRAVLPKFLPRIYSLNLNENSFKQIREKEFYPMNGSSMQQLNMCICQIVHIHPGCLSPLKNLKFLRLSQNLFDQTELSELINRTVELNIPLQCINLYDTNLQKKTFQEVLLAIKMTNISVIHVASNHLDYIDDNLFPYMPNLFTLDIRDNRISYVTPNAFKNLVNLVRLMLGENLLTAVPAGAMVHTVTMLDLASNSYLESVFIIKDEIFMNMTKLEALHLSYNSIGVISNKSFAGLINLTNLNLKNTALFQIANGAFSHLKNLQLLNLINNNNVYFTPETFKGLTNLKVLLLGGCSIRNLTGTPNLFTFVPNLKHLGLERNGLHVISPGQLTHLKRLESLDLSNNRLAPWKVNIFPHARLRTFAGNQNKFTYITAAMLEDWRSVSTLFLDDNPFSCDCSLSPVVAWLRNNVINLNMTKTEILANCISPERWHNKPILEYLIYLKNNLDQCENSTVQIGTIVSYCLVSSLIIIIIISLYYINRWRIEYFVFLMRLKKYKIWKAGKLKSLNQNNKYEFDAFVSYSKEDRNFVMELVDKMEKCEPFLKLCVYERDFQLGAVISEAVVQSVACSRHTLLVVSTAFARSQWCRWETQLAEYHQIFFRHDTANAPDDTLLIVKLEPVDREYLTPILKYLLKTRIYLQWDSKSAKQQLFWEKLRRTLSAKNIE